MTKEMRVLLMANDALKAEKTMLDEIKNKELQECVDIIEQLDGEKRAIEKKHAQFDEKYDLSQKLLAKRNDQLKDLEAALLAAREQKKTLQAQIDIKSKEVAEAKQGVVSAQAQIAQKNQEVSANLSELEAAKKDALIFKKKHKRADKESKELRAHFEKEFEKCKIVLSENAAEMNKMKAERRKLTDQLRRFAQRGKKRRARWRRRTTHMRSTRKN